MPASSQGLLAVCLSCLPPVKASLVSLPPFWSRNLSGCCLAAACYQPGLLSLLTALLPASFPPWLPQELHGAYATQLSIKGQHEQAAAHHAAAGQWAAAAKALGCRCTAVAAAAAVALCRSVLDQPGTGVVAREHAELAAQLEASLRQLEELAAAEGLDAAAASAEAAAALGHSHPLPVAPAASSSSGGSRPDARRHYSLQALLVLSEAADQASRTAQAALRQLLPEELRAGSSQHS